MGGDVSSVVHASGIKVVQTPHFVSQLPVATQTDLAFKNSCSHWETLILQDVQDINHHLYKLYRWEQLYVLTTRDWRDVLASFVVSRGHLWSLLCCMH